MQKHFTTLLESVKKEKKSGEREIEEEKNNRVQPLFHYNLKIHGFKLSNSFLRLKLPFLL